MRGSGAYIDARGNIVQPTRQEDDQQLLPTRSPQAFQQQDLESARPQSSNGWQFFGFAGFKWKSVIGAVVALQLALYFISCWVVTPRAAISPTGGALFKLGSSNAIAEMCAIRDSFPRHLIELRRWFVPIFLHTSPMHILMNGFFECQAGPALEESMGSKAFAMLFLGAGLLGNLLSDSFGVNGVGGSTSCYGIIGMDFALAYKMWPQMGEEQRQATKMRLLTMCGGLVLWEVIMWKEIDHFGHLGGFIGGFLIYLGQTEWKANVVFALVAAVCVYVICIQPLSKDDVGGFPWQAVCDQMWNFYN